MGAIITCLQVDHDWRLVLLAALVCLLSTFTVAGAYGRMLRASVRGRRAWLALAAGAGGAGVWATHFIAMLAYRTDLNIRYDLVGTGGSLVLSMLSMGLGFGIAARLRNTLGRIVGGGVIGLGVGVMHFTGIAATRLPGDLAWRWEMVLAALAVGVAGGAAALLAAGPAPDRRRQAACALLLVAAICGLHFTGMAAFSLGISPALGLGDEELGRNLLAGLIVMAGAAIALAAGAMIWMERHAHRTTLLSLRQALDGAASGIAFFDRDDRLVTWNLAFADLLAACGRTPTAGAARPVMMSALAPSEAELATGCCEAAWPDGRAIRIETTSSLQAGTTVVLTDVSADRAAAEALARARDAAEAASRAKSQFLANISHETRTPLNGVLAAAELLSREPLDERGARLLAMVRESAVRLNDLLGDILDVARLEAGVLALAPRRFDLGALVRDTAQQFQANADQKGLNLVIDDAAAQGLEVETDPARLRQILNHLLANAVKFTEQGSVRLSVTRSEDGFDFEVADTGPGVEPDRLAGMFEAFQQADGSATRRHGGVGLGLSLCVESARLIGARLEARSTPGQGSVFTLHAPLDILTDAADEPGAEPGLRVLVVDDNPVNRQVLELILDAVGAEHVSVENGLEAVEAYGRSPFDAVLMDIQMPVMDGLEATRRIRALEREGARAPSRLVIVTANGDDAMSDGREAGADACLAKPVHPAQVLGALAGAGEARQAA